MKDRTTGVLAVVALAVAAFTAQAAKPDATEAKLAKVRQQIVAMQKSLNEETTLRDTLAAKLRDAELTVAEAGRKVEALRKRRGAGEQQRLELQKERAGIERTLAAEREVLAEQLRAAHRIGGTGEEEQLKLLFNQQDPAQLGRMFVYYGYFGRSRAARIASIRAQVEQLTALDQQLTTANEALAQLEEQAATELGSLKHARSERAGVVQDLEKQIQDRQTRLARLKKQENTLEKLLADLRRVTADFPITSEEPFEKAKGRLSWPVSGRIVADFGEPRSAGLRWNGVLLVTERGSPVRAVYFGRVIYADWLTGMGLLTIVEHRGGYLSLYGHNEQLYKSVGDWVEPGDVIAAAGESGGRSRPELYFEIRKGAKPLDPRQWVKK